MAQFMQITMSNHKSTVSALKNLEVQVGQLAKQIADKSSNSFVEKNRVRKMVQPTLVKRKTKLNS